MLIKPAYFWALLSHSLVIKGDDCKCGKKSKDR